MIDEQTIRECKEGAAQCANNVRFLKRFGVSTIATFSVVTAGMFYAAVDIAYRLESWSAMVFVVNIWILLHAIAKVRNQINEFIQHELESRQEYLQIIDS